MWWAVIFDEIWPCLSKSLALKDGFKRQHMLEYDKIAVVIISFQYSFLFGKQVFSFEKVSGIA